MADQSMLQKVAALLTGGASNSMNNRAYQMHVAEAKALGEVPMTPQQFEAHQKAPPVQAPAPVAPQAQAEPAPFRF